MQKIRKQMDEPLRDTLERLYPGKNVLYYDIETTGLSASRGMVYLIGTAYKEQNHYEWMQFFAYDAIDESRLILEFADMIRSSDILVSFNGENFDMPFLKKRAEYLGLSGNIWNHKFTSFDIYKKIRKYCNVLGMANAKQKTIETFAGINRTDTVSGKELIKVYREYLIKREETMRELLLLHNFEDIRGLLYLTGMVAYCDLFEGNWNISGMEIVENGILIICKLKNRILKEMNLDNSYVWIWAADKELKFLLHIESMELKYFYDDYKNYYYLPQEDMAIHKSVAGFVEKAYKSKATKENCYLKRNGKFVKNYGLTNLPIMKKNYMDQDSYVEVNEFIQMDIQSPEFKEYLTAILQSFIK